MTPNEINLIESVNELHLQAKEERRKARNKRKARIRKMKSKRGTKSA